MQIVIDIPEDEFGVDIDDKFQDFFERIKVEIAQRINFKDTLLCGNYELETAEMLLASFKRMQILPDNATNGDIFTSIYKPYKVQKHTLYVNIYKTEYDFKQDIEWLVFSNRWWNSPYRKE